LYEHKRTWSLMLTMLVGLDEFERELIRTRAKARGVEMGRPFK
jgi:hypothetical protein